MTQPRLKIGDDVHQRARRYANVDETECGIATRQHGDVRFVDLIYHEETQEPLTCITCIARSE